VFRPALSRGGDPLPRGRLNWRFVRGSGCSAPEDTGTPLALELRLNVTDYGLNLLLSI
jgi:hypothetical protein